MVLAVAVAAYVYVFECHSCTITSNVKSRERSNERYQAILISLSQLSNEKPLEQSEIL